MSAIEMRNKSIHFACANPHSAVTAQHDNEFLEALNNAEITVADGTGITLASRILTQHSIPRITGHDYFFGLLDSLNKNQGGKIFFFGSTEIVLNLIKNEISKIFPNLTVVGTLSPPFKPWDEHENTKMVEIINNSNPDILWVGMTAPKQEKWVFKNQKQLNAPIIGSVGAVFDFVAGTHPRAPDWMRKLGLEWLNRLIREPRRMWKRNFISTPKFILYILRSRFSL